MMHLSLRNILRIITATNSDRLDSVQGPSVMRTQPARASAHRLQVKSAIKTLPYLMKKPSSFVQKSIGQSGTQSNPPRWSNLLVYKAHRCATGQADAHSRPSMGCFCMVSKAGKMHFSLKKFLVIFTTSGSTRLDSVKRIWIVYKACQCAPYQTTPLNVRVHGHPPVF